MNDDVNDDVYDVWMETPRRPARRQFLRATAGAGLALAGVAALPRPTLAAAPPALPTVSTCGESARDIIDTALMVERLATTFYYTGLTTRSIAGSARVAGSSANPNRVSPNGSPGNVAYLQAALDQEQKHARLLAALGATSRHTEFYFPAATFAELGYTSHIGSYLWVLDHLETAFISTYIAAIKRLGELGHRELAVLMARILGVECQHRALYRVIARDDPADNVTLEVAELSCVGDAVTLLTPFLTGRGFPGGATRAIHLPGQGHVARVVGLNTSS